MSRLNFFNLMFAVITSSLVTLSCTKSVQNTESQSSSLSGGKNVVHLAIWANYISPELIKNFKEKTGIDIIVSNYSSNEELLAKLQMGGGQIDVAVPSDYMVAIMSKMQLLQALPDTIENKKLLNPTLIKQSFDPDNTYSLPYSWTTTGIVVNHDLYKGEIKSWKDFFEKPELKGKIAMLDDSREVIGASLKFLGHSVNTKSNSELKSAEQLLLKTKSRVKTFTSDSVDILNNKEVVAAQAYSADALQAARRSENKIEFIIPTEGATRAIDNMVILKNAPHSENAAKLINFLLSEQADIDRVQKVMAGPVLLKTREALPAELKNNSSLFPSEKVLSKLERIQDLGEDNRTFENIWTKIKSEE